MDGERYSNKGNTYEIRISAKMKFLTPKAKVKKLFMSHKQLHQN
jgi:hypothetical protein